MIYLSIIIPTFNSAETLPRLLDSIKKEKPKDTEVIVVQDGLGDRHSGDRKGLQNRFWTSPVPYGNRASQNDGKTKIIFKEFFLSKNRGPAYARNYGARKAKGEILLFLDSDVVVLPGTIKEVIKIFKEDKYRVAATGVWDKKQESHKFFPKFKALRDWSYWVNEKKIDSYYYLFSTRIAAIRRDVFLSLGGFLENYRGADVEDIEFTYRLARKYRVDFNENMRVHHEFEDFWPIARKYFKRAYQWVEIFQNRKKFDPVTTTGSEAVTTLSAVGMIGSLGILGLLGLLGKFYILHFTFYIFLLFVICLLFFAIHLLGVRKFLVFVYKEEGLNFAFKSFFVGIALYLFIFAGAVWGMVKKSRLLRPPAPYGAGSSQ